MYDLKQCRIREVSGVVLFLIPVFIGSIPVYVRTYTSLCWDLYQSMLGAIPVYVGTYTSLFWDLYQSMLGPIPVYVGSR